MDAVSKPGSTSENKGAPPLSFEEAISIERKLVSAKTKYLSGGIPAIKISDVEVAKLAAPYALALVGKFMGKPPRLNDIAPEFNKLNLKKGFSISMLDESNLFIKLRLEEDFTKLWLKGSLFIAGTTMVLSKWSHAYTPEKDSPLVPCWVTLKKNACDVFSSGSSI